TRTNAQLIAHVRHARHRFDDVFRAAFLFAAVHAPGENDHAVVHTDLDVARVNVPVVRQTVVYIFADAFVGTTVAARAAPRIPPAPLVQTPPPLGVLVAEP